MSRALALSVIALIVMAVPARAEPLPSGTIFQSENLQALQKDEAANTGMLWVGEGGQLWDEPKGEAGKSCAACHGAAENSMTGVATRYPLVGKKSSELINLEGRINQCRTDNQKAPAYEYESDELLALTAFIARQSLGLTMNVETDGAAAPFYEAGKTFFNRRQGQMNLSCAQCHDDNAGRRLRGDTISHGLPNGYPAYRLNGSLSARCTDACAPAHSVCAPSSLITDRRNISVLSFIWQNAPRALRSRSRQSGNNHVTDFQ